MAVTDHDRCGVKCEHGTTCALDLHRPKSGLFARDYGQDCDFSRCPVCGIATPRDGRATREDPPLPRARVESHQVRIDLGDAGGLARALRAFAQLVEERIAAGEPHVFVTFS